VSKLLFDCKYPEEKVLLDAFGELRKAVISVVINFNVMSLRPSVRSHGKKSASTGQIFMKINIRLLFENLSRIFQVSFKADENNGCFT
jgi:hypothetical protein